MANTKYFSFLFTIPNWHFSPAVKITIPFEINVRYALHWNKKVEVEAFYLKPGMAKLIDDWEKLEQEIQDAAENNNKQYLAPGQLRGRRPQPQPGEDPYLDHELYLNPDIKRHY
jgi:hypothetical protein